MIVTFTPAGGSPREFAFTTTELLPEEYEPIEALGRWASLDEFDAAVRASSRTAWRVALWVCLRRDQPGLELEDVRPRANEIRFRYDPEEELAVAEMQLADPDLPAQFRELIEAALPDLRRAVGNDPGPLPSGDDATG